MGEFKRENRYLVLKRKEISKYLSDEAKTELDNILTALAVAKQPDIDTGAKAEIDCVVVEKDWPMYEAVWGMIEASAIQNGMLAQLMSKSLSDQNKACAVMHFVDTMIGALESGFVDKNNPTLAELYQVARNHIKDNYEIEFDDIVKRWGKETAEMCGLNAGGQLKMNPYVTKP